MNILFIPAAKSNNVAQTTIQLLSNTFNHSLTIFNHFLTTFQLLPNISQPLTNHLLILLKYTI